MSVSVLDRAPVTGDAGRVAGERQERPEPKVPERTRRRRFTAQYKLGILAAYEAAMLLSRGLRPLSTAAEKWSADGK